MARRPQVRYWPGRAGYWCTIRGKQHRLADGPDDFPDGPTYRSAVKRFLESTSLDAVPVSKDASSVRVMLETYLQHAEGRLSASTFERRLRVFRQFCAVHGDTPVCNLTPFILEEFVARMR